MAAPHRTEDYQEIHESSRSESAFILGTSTQEGKKYVAKKDSGVDLSKGHEASTTSRKLGTNQSKDPREDSRKHSPSSPRVSAESTRPRNTPKTTSNILKAPTPLPTTQTNQVQPIRSVSTVDKNLGSKDTAHSTKSKPRTVLPVFLKSSALFSSFDEDNGEGGNYVC